MAANGDSPADFLAGLERVLGRVRGPRPGPTLIGVGGIHGNEPAGVEALTSVLDELRSKWEDVSGEFVGLSGNRGALAQDRRFLSRDLNRLWTPTRIRSLQDANGVADPSPSCSEDVELLELHGAVHQIVAEARGPVYVMDLHTASGPTQPFTTIIDTLANRDFALGIPVPLILGLGELVEGTLMGYLADWGVASMVFEGGQHHHPETLDSLKAALWVGLGGAGVIREARHREAGAGRLRLHAATRGLPTVLEMRYRHPVISGDGFRMHPAFKSFQPVASGQTLARDRKGDVPSPQVGRILLPLYQDQGEDGFFIVREFHPFWLTVSRILRRLRAGRIVHWLPGVQKDPKRPNRLLVDRKLARWYTLQILHLLGYRKKIQVGGRLVVQRQGE